MFLKSILSDTTVAPIEAVGKVLDLLFTSDKERLDKITVLARLTEQAYAVQGEIGKIEASHRSLFVAGWRPFVGWICGAALAYTYILRDVMASFILSPESVAALPTLNMSELSTLLYALLGLGGLRTFEKLKGRAG
jgi:hypothetical protein